MAETNYLKTFAPGETITSNETNNNNQFLLKQITDSASNVKTYVDSQLSALLNKVNNVIKVGVPQLSLDGILPNNCVWYEGAEVSRETYALLFEIFDTTYGEGNGITTFNLPNFVGRVPWGATDYGYIEPGLPNITAQWDADDYSSHVSGATYIFNSGGYVAKGGTTTSYRLFGFDASRCSSVYKNEIKTVQPPGLKVRVYGRYQ